MQLSTIFVFTTIVFGVSALPSPRISINPTENFPVRQDPTTREFLLKVSNTVNSALEPVEVNLRFSSSQGPLADEVSCLFQRMACEAGKGPSPACEDALVACEREFGIAGLTAPLNSN